ncbi:hypothetical protein [Burkholderia sp. USMB20]|nr:hypothetical protein [Burkholderia sp. USMB20]
MARTRAERRVATLADKAACRRCARLRTPRCRLAFDAAQLARAEPP